MTIMYSFLGSMKAAHSSTFNHANEERDYTRQLEYEIGQASEKCAQSFDKNTRLPKKEMPLIEKESVTEWGELLGKGGFNQVRAVVVKRKEKEDDTEVSHDWAVKHLKPSVMKTRSSFYAGSVDLVTEAKLLSALKHSNIIRLHGVSSKSLRHVYDHGGHYDMFLDRLSGTVEEQFDRWRKAPNHHMSKEKRQEQLRQRLENIVLPMAQALEYLHGNHVIFRDIKPSNMGFAADGTVKLFDFGLARELHPQSNKRQLTGATGSRRCMAPEVALSFPYGLPADVYSFGVFLFECTTLDKPFEGMTRIQHMERVVHGRKRPEFHNHNESCCKVALEQMVKLCWARNSRARPVISKVVKSLQQQVNPPNDSRSQEEPRDHHHHHKYLYNWFRWSMMKSSPEANPEQGACAA